MHFYSHMLLLLRLLAFTCNKVHDSPSVSLAVYAYAFISAEVLYKYALLQRISMHT